MMKEGKKPETPPRSRSSGKGAGGIERGILKEAGGRWEALG